MHEVPAILLTNASAPAHSLYTTPERPQAEAIWVTPGGAQNIGKITVAAGATAGSFVTVVVNASGQLAKPPVTVPPPLVAVGAVAGAGLVLLIASRVARSLLDRRRLAAWDTAWRVTSPRWTPGRL
jgi:hypothetical protein